MACSGPDRPQALFKQTLISFGPAGSWTHSLIPPDSICDQRVEDCFRRGLFVGSNFVGVQWYLRVCGALCARQRASASISSEAFDPRRKCEAVDKQTIPRRPKSCARTVPKGHLRANKGVLNRAKADSLNWCKVMQTRGNYENGGECRASSHAGGPGFESLRAHHSL